MDNFGHYLKTHREKKGIRLEEIASITKIHLHSLELLESSQWSHLPPEPFIRGFIIAYAKYVGLDPKETISKYLEELNIAPPAASAEPLATEAPAPRNDGTPVPTPTELIENAETLPTKKVFIAAAVAAALGVTVGIIYIGKNSVAPTAATEPAPVTEVAVAPAPEPSPAASPTPEAAPAQTAFKIPEAPPAPVTHAAVAPPVTPPAPAPVAAVATPAPVAPPAPAPATTTASAETAAPEKPRDDHEVVIEGKERTWIKVVVDDSAPVEYFLPEGEKAKYNAKNKIKVVLGNSTGSKVVHNGELSPGTKFQGTIRSYIFPSDARFPQDIPTKRSLSQETSTETTTEADN